MHPHVEILDKIIRHPQNDRILPSKLESVTTKYREPKFVKWHEKDPVSFLNAYALVNRNHAPRPRR